MSDFETDLEVALTRFHKHRVPAWDSSRRRPALLIVDLMYAFTDAASPVRCDANDAVVMAAHLLDTARSHDRPVIHVHSEYDDSGLRAAATFLEKVPALTVLSPGSHWSQIDDRVAPEPNEPVLTKLFASAFFETALRSLLVAAGCDSVVCVGTSTSGCVRATVVDAMQHGFRAFVPRDAVADRSIELHQLTLQELEAKYATVLGVDDTVAVLDGRPLAHTS